MELLSLLIASGLVIGAAYGLIAMGFALIYKSTGVVNFAQGELMMLTAYIAFSLASALDLSFVPLIAATLPIAMGLGLFLERVFIRPMLGEPPFTIVMVTLGLAVILRSVTILIWGSEPFNFPAGLPQTVVKIAGLPFYPAQIALMVACALVLAAVAAFLRFSRYGVAMRATAANETAALLSGVSVSRVHALAWMMSSAIAAISGLLFAVNFKLAPDMWFQGLKAFPAVILGGLDSIPGAALGGLAVGLIESLSQGYIGEGSREIAGFVVIIVVLMARPYGLFGSRDIERV